MMVYCIKDAAGCILLKDYPPRTMGLRDLSQLLMVVAAPAALTL